jgi:hypothetical protein
VARLRRVSQGPGSLDNLGRLIANDYLEGPFGRPFSSSCRALNSTS